MGQPSATVYASAADTESRTSDTQPPVSKPVKSWKGYIWDTWDLPPDQRWLLFKVDAFVLTFASVRCICPANFEPTLIAWKAWIFLEKSRPVQCAERFPQRHGRRSGHVWQSIGDQHVHLDRGIRHRPDSIQPSLDAHLTTMGYSSGNVSASSAPPVADVSTARSRLGCCYLLHRSRQKLQGTICPAFPRRLF